MIGQPIWIIFFNPAAANQNKLQARISVTLKLYFSNITLFLLLAKVYQLSFCLLHFHFLHLINCRFLQYYFFSTSTCDLQKNCNIVKYNNIKYIMILKNEFMQNETVIWLISLLTMPLQMCINISMLWQLHLLNLI